MVCIAAFIILCVLSIFVGILSIFRRDLGRKYWKTFKKAWGCVGKKVTLQKCETGFKEDIKNSILKKVIVKKPKLVKPISVGIEVAAVAIVVVTLWSLITAVKSGLALWTLGTCDVQRPAACAFGAEVCSIDGDEPKNVVEAVGYWFTDWGEIFGAIPDKFRSWEAKQFDDLSGVESVAAGRLGDVSVAIDIFDPGCAVCLQSYRKQMESGFFDSYAVRLVPFPIQNPDGSYKFRNSGVISRWVLAVGEFGVPEAADDASRSTGQEILTRIFTESREDGVNWQTVFNDYLSDTEAEGLIQQWLAEWGYSEAEISALTERAAGAEVAAQLARNQEIVTDEIHAKGIPTMIYDGRKHTGRFEP